jgi:tape measure domain-containing protein
MPTIKGLGDIAGGNQEKFDRLALAFGQVAAKGRLMGQEANQLGEHGFNVLKLIAARTGESMLALNKRMEDGKISLREVALALQDVTGEGGRFNNGMEAMSRTLSGRWSTFKDNVEELGRAFGSILVPALTKTVAAMNEVLDAISRIANSNLGNVIKQTAIAGIDQAITNTLNNLKLLAQALIDFDKSALGGIHGLAFKGWFDVPGLQTIIDAINQIPIDSEKAIAAIGDVYKVVADTSLSKEMLKEMEALEKAWESLEKAASKATEEAMTPLEKYIERFKELSNLLEEGLISTETFDRLVGKGRESLLKIKDASRPVLVEAKDMGSAAALNARAEFEMMASKKRHEEEVLEIMRKELTLLERTAVALEKEKPSITVKKVTL